MFAVDVSLSIVPNVADVHKVYTLGKCRRGFQNTDQTLKGLGPQGGQLKDSVKSRPADVGQALVAGREAGEIGIGWLFGSLRRGAVHDKIADSLQDLFELEGISNGKAGQPPSLERPAQNPSP